MDVPATLAAWIASKSFLVVEDITSSRLLVEGLLRSAGAVKVEAAEDGQAALDKIARKGVPDIVFCDWNMPGMDGLTLLARVKEAYPAVKVIMLTANTDPDHVRAAGSLKADGYIGKPFTSKVLLDKLAKLAAAE